MNHSLPYERLFRLGKSYCEETLTLQETWQDIATRGDTISGGAHRDTISGGAHGEATLWQESMMKKFSWQQNLVLRSSSYMVEQPISVNHRTLTTASLWNAIVTLAIMPLRPITLGCHLPLRSAEIIRTCLKRKSLMPEVSCSTELNAWNTR